jgi:K+-sensing histidine kinase KdpD
LWEVVHNAVIYSLNTQVQISLYASGQSIIVDIKDHGIGVPKGSEDLIFLQFYKGQSDLKVRRGHRGLGLGLFLARYITEQHGGQLILVKQGERGSLFRFLLPLMATVTNRNVS